MYFNVKWLSAYPDEKERLFVEAQELMIVDVLFFSESQDMVFTALYVGAMRLWSSLFDGHFVIAWMRRSKIRNKTQQALRRLVVNYAQHNGFAQGDAAEETFRIELYVQQLFF